MKTLAIDHGTNTGFCYMKDGKIQTYGIIQIPGDSIGEKVFNFRNKAQGLLESFKPDMLVIEKPNHLRNAQTTLLLSGFYTTLLALGHEFMAEVIQVHPSSLKKAVTGSGRSEKMDVAHAMSVYHEIPITDMLHYDYYKVGRNKGKIKTTYYDATDAIALATYGEIEKLV